jgi:hypothetical protein
MHDACRVMHAYEIFPPYVHKYMTPLIFFKKNFNHLFYLKIMSYDLIFYDLFYYLK